MTVNMLSDDERAALLLRAGAFVRRHMKGDPGHDWTHVERTVDLGRRIATAEGADAFLVELALTFHDIADEKFTRDENAAERLTREFLGAETLDARAIEAVCAINRSISFRAGQNAHVPLTREARCAQDADRLEAMGAIGIARTFSYAGHKGNPLGDPRNPEPDSAVAHFHDKLLRLKGLMHTETGRRIAKRRHRVLEAFLAQLEREWRGVA